MCLGANQSDYSGFSVYTWKWYMLPNMRWQGGRIRHATLCVTQDVRRGAGWNTIFLGSPIHSNLKSPISCALVCPTLIVDNWRTTVSRVGKENYYKSNTGFLLICFLCSVLKTTDQLSFLWYYSLGADSFGWPHQHLRSCCMCGLNISYFDMTFQIWHDIPDQ